MAALTVTPPFPIFTDTDGTPLENGYVYIGTTALNAETNPIQVYWDAALSIPAAQPIRTIGGYASRSGSPGQLYVNAVNYSIIVRDGGGSLVWSSLTGTGISPNAAGITYSPAGTGAVDTTVQAKLRRLGVSPEDKGAAADGVTDDTAAIQLAINEGFCTLTPGKTYVFGQLSMPDNAVLWGYGATLKVKASANNFAIINSGSTGFQLLGFTLDGNYTNQTSGSAIVLSTVTNTVTKDVKVRDVYGTGILLSAGSGNTVTECEVKACGKSSAGYGIYVFASDDNKVTNNKVSDTCIGIVVEASGVLTAKRNIVTGNISTDNRADFTQSGAGIHIECSGGNSVDYTEICGNTASSNAGPGISQTNGIGNNITGNQLSDNAFAGISSAGCVNTVISSNTCIGNGASAAAGYQCAILADGCTGVVSGNRGSGSVEGIKTFSASSLAIVGNDVRGNSSAAINTSATGTDVTANNKGHDHFGREPNPPVVFFDDFTGKTLNGDVWTGTVGSDGACVAPAIVTGQLRGLVRMTTGAGAGATMAVNGVQIDSALTYQPTLGAMVFEARVAITSVITTMAIFVGVTDQAGALGMPINASGVGDGVTANRTNACGFMYDTAMSTDNWWIVGNSSTGAGTPQNVGSAPVQSTYETFRIEFPISGSSATFFRNGVLVGSTMANGLYAGAPVTPVVAAFSRAASSRVIDIDYIKMQSAR